MFPNLDGPECASVSPAARFLFVLPCSFSAGLQHYQAAQAREDGLADTDFSAGQFALASRGARVAVTLGWKSVARNDRWALLASYMNAQLSAPSPRSVLHNLRWLPTIPHRV